MFSNSSLPSSKPGQDPDCDESKTDYIDIDAVLSENEKLKALLEEKEALLRRESKCDTSSDPIYEGLDLKLAGTSSTEESAATCTDYKKAQVRKLDPKSLQNSTVAHETYAANAMVRGVKEKQIINNIGRRRGGAEWDEHLHESESLLDEDGTYKMSWYSPPVQRQRWFDDLVLPQIDAGDVFFDIFYGGGANNLGALLGSSTFGEGEALRCFIHFFGSLGPLWITWEVQAFYESRYLAYDYFHNLVSIIRYLCIGFAIFNIAPLQLYTDPRTGNVMVFTLAMLVELVLSMGLALEVYFRGVGDRISIMNHTRDDFKFRDGASFVLYAAAFIVSAVQCVQARQSFDQQKDRSIWDLYDLPMTLNASAYLVRFILSSVRILCTDKREFRDSFVPTNIDYLIDRYEGFIMVLMGVGVASLLNVDKNESSEFYVTEICGLLTMIFLHVLKMDSESDSSKHALRRGRIPAAMYSFLVHILTISLIGFGVSYVVFFDEIFQPANTDYLDFARFPFLTVTIISLEFMRVTHCGLKEAFDRLFQTSEGKRKLNWPVVIGTLLRVGIILFCLTLYTWTNDPETLAACGFAAVFSVFLTHLLNTAFIEKTKMTLVEDKCSRKHRPAMGNGRSEEDCT